MVCILKKPSKFQLHFMQNLMWNICLNFIWSNAKFKTVQKLFSILVQLTLQFMSYQTILVFGPFLDHFWVDLSNWFWNSVMIRFKLCINYYFDYLDKKSIFFGKTKTVELLSMEFILRLQKNDILILVLSFFNQFR